MAARKRSTARRSKARRWIIPKVLLVLACVALLALIGVLYIIEKELRRSGIFRAGPSAVSESGQSMSHPAGTADVARPQTRAPSSEEMTPVEREQLDEILRSRSE